MKVWAAANQKGGVGKTTTVMSLASHLSLRGHSCLVLDLDPQGSLSTCFDLDIDSNPGSAYDLFQHADGAGDQVFEDSIRTTSVNNIAILPANPAMATLDRNMGTSPGMGVVIRKALARIDNDFDFVILDCPPHLGLLMVNALFACDLLIIPVQTEFLALKGLERMLKTVAMIRHSTKQDLNHVIVPTHYDKRTRASVQTLARLRADHAQRCWPRFIPVDTEFRDASSKRRPLPHLHPAARGSLAYGQLLDYVEQEFVDQPQVATG